MNESYQEILQYRGYSVGRDYDSIDALCVYDTNNENRHVATLLLPTENTMQVSDDIRNALAFAVYKIMQDGVNA